MRKIYRLRQRSSKVDHAMPWRTVYLMPTEALETVYPTLGRAISFRWDPDHANSRWVELFCQLSETRARRTVAEDVLELEDYSVVVPVQVDYDGRARGLYPHERAQRAEMRNSREYMKVTKPGVLEELRRNVPPITVALHFDTGPEGMEPLCGNCVNVQSHLMGQCTPGLIRCAPSVVVPAAERLVHIRRKAQQT